MARARETMQPVYDFIDRHVDQPFFIIGHITQHRAEDDVMGRKAEGYYLRTPKWHFMWYTSEDRMALYDMENDPNDMENVIAEHPDLATQFMNAIETWKKEALSVVVGF